MVNGLPTQSQQALLQVMVGLVVGERSEGPVLSVPRTRRQLGAICHATLLSIIGVL